MLACFFCDSKYLPPAHQCIFSIWLSTASKQVLVAHFTERRFHFLHWKILSKRKGSIISEGKSCRAQMDNQLAAHFMMGSHANNSLDTQKGRKKHSTVRKKLDKVNAQRRRSRWLKALAAAVALLLYWMFLLRVSWLGNKKWCFLGSQEYWLPIMAKW